jgi:chromosome segregation ATPase
VGKKLFELSSAPREGDEGGERSYPSVLSVKTLIKALDEQIGGMVVQLGAEESGAQVARKKSAVEAQLVEIREKVSRAKVRVQACGKWKQRLNSIVHEINRGFAERFEKLGHVGEVKLTYGPNGDEQAYESYGISILCAFKNGRAATKMSVQQQSGGEKHIATVMYIIAMQGCQGAVSRAPLHVFDEINQNMDGDYERASFQALTEEFTTGVPSQLFLVSPKLTCGLEYGALGKTTVFMASRGQHGDCDQSAMDAHMAKALGERRMLESSGQRPRAAAAGDDDAGAIIRPAGAKRRRVASGAVVCGEDREGGEQGEQD